MEQKIKQDSIRIGENIRRIRLAQHIKQTQLVQLSNFTIIAQRVLILQATSDSICW